MNFPWKFSSSLWIPDELLQSDRLNFSPALHQIQVFPAFPFPSTYQKDSEKQVQSK